jgi:ATP-dependent Clp protease ATP-binding subunit ClpC
MDEKPGKAYAAGLPFTDKAQQAIERANLARLRFGHKRLCAEHLLLGMAEGECLANAILRSVGVDHAKIAERLRNFLQILQPSQRALATEIVKLAVESAKETGNDYLGTEHLLLGLIKERNGLAGAILRETFSVASLTATIRDCLRGP